MGMPKRAPADTFDVPASPARYAARAARRPASAPCAAQAEIDQGFVAGDQDRPAGFGGHHRLEVQDSSTLLGFHEKLYERRGNTRRIVKKRLHVTSLVQRIARSAVEHVG